VAAYSASPLKFGTSFFFPRSEVHAQQSSVSQPPPFYWRSNTRWLQSMQFLAASYIIISHLLHPCYGQYLSEHFVFTDLYFLQSSDRLFTGFSPRRSRFKRRGVHMGYRVGKVELGHRKLFSEQSVFPLNVADHLPSDAASCPRRREATISPL
jgi:hypothetical protein